MSEERRRHARIGVDLTCTVEGPAGSGTATMRDISAVGARLVSSRRVAEELEHLQLEVAAAEDHDGLSVRARVMYQRQRDEGLVAGVQFVDMDAATHRRVEAFLASALAGGGGGGREHPRVARRIEVSCRSRKRAQGVLEDISRGGVRVLVPEDVEVGETLQISIAFGALERPLELSGPVVRAQSLEDGRRYAAVRLAERSDADQALLDQLLKALVQ